MQVTADIRRSDLVNLNLYVYPRHRNTYIIFALFVVIGLAIPLVHDGKFSSQGLLLGLAIGVAMGLIMVVFTFSSAFSAKLYRRRKIPEGSGSGPITFRTTGLNGRARRGMENKNGQPSAP
jgi:hypothetical protein